MFTTRWRLFHLRGIPISVDASWLIILALLTWTLISVFQGELAGLSVWSASMLGLVVALAFFACLVLHELGHALVAQHLGIRIRGINLFLFGGVAEMEDEPASAGGEFAMAIAGPVVSAVLSGVFWSISLATQSPQLLVPLRFLAGINLAVLVFNLVPAFPLDGGRVLRSILWATTGDLRRATYWGALAGQAFAWLLVCLGILEFFSGHLFQGVWLGLIGLFVNRAAQGGYQQVLVRLALRGEHVSQLMHRNPIVVPAQLDLNSWVRSYVYPHHRRLFPVADDGHLEGVISTKALAHFPREEWSRHTVGEVMAHDLEPLKIAPEADLVQALEKMQHSGTHRLLVMDGDRLVGTVRLRDLQRFVNLKIELEKSE